MSTTPSVVTDLVGKRVTVWHIDCDSPGGRRGDSGLVRAVTFGDRNFHLLLQIDQADRYVPSGALVMITITEYTTVVPEPAAG